jgi:NAD+ synthase
MKEIKLAEIDREKVIGTIKKFIVENVLKFNSTGCVIGLSGGVDSTLVAILARQAFDDYNEKNKNKLELKGYVLPSNVNNLDDAKDGVSVAKRLGIEYSVIDIEPFAKVCDESIEGVVNSRYDRGNMLSRIRANILHTFAALENKLVIGTGNYDEDFCLGYYTLFGDGAVHMSPIGSLSKRHVRELVKVNGFTDIAKREPTAGLEKGQTDFGDLGYNYEMVELIVGGLNQGFSVSDLKEHFQVIDMFEKFKFDSKFDDVAQVVDDVIVRHKVALKKAKLVSPPVCEIEKRYV